MDSNCMPPGFRFHPTDEELMIHYLRPKLNGQGLKFDIIPEVDLYKCEPWDLPEKSLRGGSDTEWYFFVVLNKKYPRGARSNRSTKCGFWKTTGKDKPVKIHSKKVGMKKTLVFYEGRAPHGKRTDWVMYEYRLENGISKKVPPDAVVLCQVSKKKKASSIDTEEQISSLDNQDNDDVPFTEADANMGLTTDLETRPRTDCGSEIVFQLDREDPFPVDESVLMGEPEGRDVCAAIDEEMIKEIYDFLLNMPPTTEATGDDVSEAEIIEDSLQLITETPGQATGFEEPPEFSLRKSIDEILAEDPWQLGNDLLSSSVAGDAVDPQGHLGWLRQSDEAYSSVSQTLQFAAEDSTQVEITSQLLSKNSQNEPLSLSPPLMNAVSSTQITFATNGSSSQPIISSEPRPLSRSLDLLDAFSVPPASAAEFPPSFKDVFMPPLSAPSQTSRAPNLSSKSVKSLGDSTLVKLETVQQCQKMIAKGKSVQQCRSQCS
ncbi:hypothetical protein O6H91_18G003000 [Diphasiastrum complanatum]|uniref:Uncharacterized protein n=1 Tax=Diphasiastrum complanatum TaxID=34168 RepID=A0ACC2AXI5_DIPCM|nr:hypothetical protein O6H91_18G003000 [Diphasiastrum complanatum]